MKNNSEKLQNDLAIANTKLSLVTKENVAPTWLLTQTNLREEMKWAVALHFKLTKEAKILCDHDSSAGGEPTDVVRLMVPYRLKVSIHSLTSQLFLSDKQFRPGGREEVLCLFLQLFV